MPADFMSGRAMGKPPPRRPEYRPLWDGLSVFDTLERARAKARDMRDLGSPIGDYLARLEIPDDVPITSERTTSSRGHFTLAGQLHLLIGVRGFG
jgi:hypothetical protein